MKAHVIRAAALLCGLILSALANSEGFTDLRDAIQHPTSGCGNFVLDTPRPGTQFANPLAHVPGSVEPFFAKAARLHVKWQSSVTCRETDLRHYGQPLCPPPGVALPNSCNWSGYEVFNTAQYVQTGYTVPTVSTPRPQYDSGFDGYKSSAWAGIGAAPNAGTPLIQSGTEHDQDVNGAATYFFWYEIVGGQGDTGHAIQYGPPASPGDDVGSVAIWRSDTQHTILSNCNFSTTGCFQFETTIPTSPPGNSVEWIVEAPLENDYIQPLADFNTVSFYNACFVRDFVYGGSNTCEPIAAGTQPTGVKLLQYVLNQWQSLAEPHNLAGDSVSSSFDAI
jgi:hypothetical protein